MKTRKKILAIIGSTRENSSSLKLVKKLAAMTIETFDFLFFEAIAGLPHFNPDLETENPPSQIIDFRNQISNSDAVIICTPEYVFSLPGSLKNALEWCVSTTLFSQKPVGLITASASGEKGHEELKLIMKTVGARFNDDTTLLVKGIKGRFDDRGTLTDFETLNRLNEFLNAFTKLLNE
jgi:chromate reductase, NAD(P)H dehydrogenase (quinone)